MKTSGKSLRTCPKGHQFHKTTECPTCPVCEKESRPTEGFLAMLSSPARNALRAIGIDSLQKLSSYTKREILELHGIGPASIPILSDCLHTEGLSFKSISEQ